MGRAPAHVGAGGLSGLRVIDMTHVIAVPPTGQMRADLGADVVKVERLGDGDDVRKLGPPWLPDEDGRPTGEATYFQCVNWIKRSVQFGIANPEGPTITRRPAEKADMLLEDVQGGTLVS